MFCPIHGVSEVECSCAQWSHLPAMADAKPVKLNRITVAPKVTINRSRQAEIELLRAVSNGALPGFVEAENMAPGEGRMRLYTVSGAAVEVTIKDIPYKLTERSTALDAFHWGFGKYLAGKAADAAEKRLEHMILTGVDPGAPSGDHTTVMHMNTQTGVLTRYDTPTFAGAPNGAERKAALENTAPKIVDAEKFRGRAADDFDAIRRRMKEIGG